MALTEKRSGTLFQKRTLIECLLFYDFLSIARKCSYFRAKWEFVYFMKTAGAQQWMIGVRYSEREHKKNSGFLWTNSTLYLGHSSSYF